MQFYCAADKDSNGYYNQLATLTFTSFESAIKQLFYFNYSPDIAVDIDYKAFNLTALILAFVFFVFLTCVTFGISVPAGVFVPTLMSGALLGRTIGQGYDGLLNGGFFNTSDDYGSLVIDPGAYAVVGAASMLGGVTHMVISLTVIVVECTDGLNLALPIMFALFCAKYVSSRFGHGLYDRYIEEAQVGFLEWSAPKYFNLLRAEHVMQGDLIVLREVESIHRIHKILKARPDISAFPVIRPRRDIDGAAGLKESNLGMHAHIPGTLQGVMLRNHLLVLLSQPHAKAVSTKEFPAEDTVTAKEAAQDFYNLAKKIKRQRAATFDSQASGESELGAGRLLTHHELEANYPRYPKLEEHMADNVKRRWIDLSPYVGIPYTVRADATLMRTYKLFRHLGIRHLIVTRASTVAEHCEAVGIITRANLRHEEAEAAYVMQFGEKPHSHGRCSCRRCCSVHDSDDEEEAHAEHEEGLGMGLDDVVERDPRPLHAVTEESIGGGSSSNRDSSDSIRRNLLDPSEHVMDESTPSNVV